MNRSCGRKHENAGLFMCVFQRIPPPEARASPEELLARIVGTLIRLSSFDNPHLSVLTNADGPALSGPTQTRISHPTNPNSTLSLSTLPLAPGRRREARDSDRRHGRFHGLLRRGPVSEGSFSLSPCSNMHCGDISANPRGPRNQAEFSCIYLDP
jgi:hypothetical protein